MTYPIFTISIEPSGDLLLKNKVDNQELARIPTKDIHYLYITKPTDKNTHHLKEQSFCFQMIKDSKQLTLLADYFDCIDHVAHINHVDYVTCTLKINLDCMLETSINNYPNISESAYENLICVKNNTNSLWFINLDYVYDIIIEPNIVVHSSNYLFRFKNIQSSFVYERSLLSELNKYIVQLTLDNQIFYLGNIQEFNILLRDQIQKSKHIQKSQNTMRNLIMFQEKLDNLLKLEQQMIFE